MTGGSRERIAYFYGRYLPEPEVEELAVSPDRAGHAEVGGEPLRPPEIRVGERAHLDPAQMGEGGEMGALGPQAGPHDPDPDAHVDPSRGLVSARRTADAVAGPTPGRRARSVRTRSSPRMR